MASLITTAITNYSSTDLEVFDTVFRYSPFVTLIDEVDTAILSNITNIKISKTFKPTLGTALKYTITFSNPFYELTNKQEHLTLLLFYERISFLPVVRFVASNPFHVQVHCIHKPHGKLSAES